MPDNMNYNNSQPLGYGDPMDPAWQYQQGYAGGMPNPQDLYGQGYVDPNQMYGDPNQMYGQPMQQDPYNPYGAQGGYMDPNAGMGMGGYMDMDHGMNGQMPYADPYAQQGFNAQQPYGQQQMGVNAMPMGAAPQVGAQAVPSPAPAMEAQPARQNTKQNKQPVPMGPAPSDGKATLCIVFGILSVVFALIPPIGIVFGILTRSMSSKYMRAGGRSPRAESGRIFGTVGLIFSLILLAALIIMGIIIWGGLYGESIARKWAVFFNNSPFGGIVRIPVPSPI